MAAAQHRIRKLGLVPDQTESTIQTTQMDLAYDGDGNVVLITKHAGLQTYQKTFTWVAGNLVAISEWVQV